MEFISNVFTTLADILWSTPLIVLTLGVSFYFTIRTFGVQFRYIKKMPKYLFRLDETEAGLSSLQAACTSLAGNIGTGNVIGVATAIFYGGPGAVFWMWCAALVGAATSFAENTLAQVYKIRIDGEYKGGPSYYMERGFKIKALGKALGIFFAFLMIFGNLMPLPGLQANNMASTISYASGGVIPVWGIGIVLCIVIAYILFSGNRKIPHTAEKIVPVMSVIYLLIAIVILIINFRYIPAAFKLIFGSAFSQDAIFGGLAGSAFAWGLRRGFWSNEAGQGMAPNAAASADVSHPAIQGIAQSFGVYVDTLFVCTATGLMIIMTQSYNVIDAATGVMVAENIPGVEMGNFTQVAVNTLIPGAGSWIVAIILTFFCFTTILANWFYTETNVDYLFKSRDSRFRRNITNILKLLFLAGIMYSTLVSNSVAWAGGDVALGATSWVNLIVILIMSKTVIDVFKDYERQIKSGKTPVFKASVLNVENTEIWNEIGEEYEQSEKKKSET